MRVDGESVPSAKRGRELFHRLAIDILDVAAEPADRMMMMLSAASNVSGFAVIHRSNRGVSALGEKLERAIHRRERDPAARMKQIVHFSRG